MVRAARWLPRNTPNRPDVRPGADDAGLKDAIREAITRKPKGHDFDYSRHRVEGQVGRHMSVTGG